MFAVAMEGL